MLTGNSKSWVIGSLVTVVSLLVAACAPAVTPLPPPSQTPPPPATIKAVSQAESQRIAREFLRSSPTFAFDGIEDTLRLSYIITAPCLYCWVFTFEFESRHAGYGDRTGRILAQVITPHATVIAVEQGEIKSAVMDHEWDMINHRMR
jgi:hypothetical protein